MAVLAVEAVCGQGRDLQEGRSWVEEEIDTVTGEEFAACDVSARARFAVSLAANAGPAVSTAEPSTKALLMVSSRGGGVDVHQHR